MKIELHIPGTPVAKGSAKAFVVKSKQTGKHRAIVTQDNAAKQRPWASAITLAARDAMRGESPVAGPCRLEILFTMPRPKRHYRTGKYAAELRPDAERLHITKPDKDKLDRCVMDALTGVAWRDDSQVCWSESKKQYGDNPGAAIWVEEITYIWQEMQ